VLRSRVTDRTTDEGFALYQEARVELWNTVARAPSPRNLSRYYHERLADLYRFRIPEGSRVIELGSGNGDLLAALRPSRGVGIDFSEEMVRIAQERHPELEFLQADVHDLDLSEPFDYVVLSDLVNDLWDVQAVLERVAALCTPDTRIIVNFYNKLWQSPLGVARRTGFADPLLPQNWLTVQDVANLLHLAGFEVVTTAGEVLWPVATPLLTRIFNRYVVKFWPFTSLALTEFIVARPRPGRVGVEDRELTVSVVVPARNEAGNIEAILDRVPQMGAGTELIFVEGNSTDDTYDVIERLLAERGDDTVALLRQPGKGKGDAVRFGFAHATGDVLMILDADLTVAPEDLPRFYRAIVDGTGDFINGVRLVYPMEGEAMQFLNLLGNKFFGIVFSWLLRQPVRDTLCGTKVLSRDAYDVIVENRAYFGDFDPFGDFDLLFGAAKANMKIIDMPVRYRDRTYGSTNIDRWRHGVLLLRMSAFAARRLRFI